MQSIANEGTIRELSNLIRVRVPRLSEECGVLTENGNSEYTQAVGMFWKEYCLKKGSGWTLHPDKFGSDPKKTKEEKRKQGEYLVDFILFEEGYGPRIACESEWSMKDKDLEWDFDKLRGVKADIKILIYQRDFKKGVPPKEIENIFLTYLENSSAIYSDEAFLFAQFCGGESKFFWWKPNRQGPFERVDIKLKPVLG